MPQKKPTWHQLKMLQVLADKHLKSPSNALCFNPIRHYKSATQAWRTSLAEQGLVKVHRINPGHNRYSVTEAGWAALKDAERLPAYVEPADPYTGVSHALWLELTKGMQPVEIPPDSERLVKVLVYSRILHRAYWTIGRQLQNVKMAGWRYVDWACSGLFLDSIPEPPHTQILGWKDDDDLQHTNSLKWTRWDYDPDEKPRPWPV